METLQAADAYAMSPCGEITKLNLVTALTAYIQAWRDKLQCSGSGNMVIFCDDKKLKEAVETFSTPLDLRVQASLARAFLQKGIVKADFPAAVRGDLQHFAGPGDAITHHAAAATISSAILVRSILLNIRPPL